MSLSSNDPDRVTLSQSGLNSGVQSMSNLASRPIHGDDLVSPGNSSFCSSIHTAHGTPQDMKDWTMNGAESRDQAISSSKPDSPAVQMLAFSMSRQLMTPTVGPNDVMFPEMTDFPAVQDPNDGSDMSQDLNYSYMDFFDSDPDMHSGTPDDTNSDKHSSHTEDGQLIMSPDPWNPMMDDAGQYPRANLGQLSSGIFQPIPISPPLTEASNDVSVTSSCSHPGFPSFMATDDALLGDFTSIGDQGGNPMEPLFPNTALTDQNPNETIRPIRSSRRVALPAASQPQVKTDPEFFPSLPLRDPVRQKLKDNAEARNPRDHPFYSMPTHSDGKYHCPFATGDETCNHTPTTQKCAYHKYLDSHLKPYRCKVDVCVDAQLRFSSNACLFRHEREAHGLHGHGDNPNLCLWEGCERSVPGYGFPRRWNLFDHMRRVHDYTTSELPSSPEASPVTTIVKKKETAGRKRRVTGAIPGQTMKRTRSVHSQTSSFKATQSSAHQGHRLQNAERSYYYCRSRLLEELGSITPQDSTMHDKVNASLQELFTLGLNYRHIEASHTMPHPANGSPSA